MAAPLEMARRAARNLGRAARRAIARSTRPAGEIWIELELKPPFDEVDQPRLGAPVSCPLLETLEVLDTALGDERVAGVLLRLRGAPGGFSRTQSLRRALLRLRRQGLPVVAYAELLDAESLLLGSAATQLWLPETGRVFLVGLRADSFHLRGLLDRLDIRADVVRIGSHKSAAEMFTRERMSPEQRGQMEEIADDWYGALVSGIAAGRGLTEAAVRELVDAGPYTAPAAVEAGLADACVYPDEIEERLRALARPPADAGPRCVRRIDARVYHAWLRESCFEPIRGDAPRLAYVVARGSIARGAGSRGIASDTLSAELERLRKHPDVRGVVLRVDSPGGDALASDLLWRSITRVREEKPVVASIGEVAASGGYYLASASDHVMAESGALTGSIGVIGGKLDLEGFYRRIGIGRDAVERGARAGLLSEARAFTEDERKALRDEMGALYRVFMDRVATGRGMTLEAVERVAGGRVWSGLRARQHGLVDAFGGPLEALAEVSRRAGLLRGERVPLEVYPRRARVPSLRILLRWLAS